MKRRRKRILLGIGILLLVWIGNYLISLWLGRKITISRETTYLSEPLRPDGTVDYCSALDKRLSEGVTPENNAAAALFNIIGPEWVCEEIRREAAERMGISVPPADGEYFKYPTEYLGDLGPDRIPLVFKRNARVTPDRMSIVKSRFHKLGKRLKEVPGEFFETYKLRNPYFVFLDRIKEAQVEPWSADTYPLVAGWVKANETSLARLGAAARRPRYYLPRLPPRPSSHLYETLHPHIWALGTVAEAMTARAMLRAHAGDFSGAMADALTIRRLACLMARSTWSYQYVMHSSTTQVVQALAVTKRLASTQARNFLGRLQALPPIPSPAEGMTLGERFRCLSVAQGLARGAVLDAPELDAREWRGISYAPLQWNVVLHKINAHFDLFEEAWRFPRPERPALDLMELRRMDGRCPAWAVARLILLSGVPVAGPRIMSSEFALSLCHRFCPMDTFLLYYDRARADWRLSQLAFALRAFQGKAGRLPDDLGELVPDILDELPADPFSERPFVYRRQGEGYVLYSVGENGRDDGGEQEDPDVYPEPRKDDIAVRFQG